MEVKKQPRLTFKGVSFPIVELHAQKVFNGDDEQLEFTITPKVHLPTDTPEVLNVIITVEASVEEYFRLKVVGVGSFFIKGDDIDDEIRKNFVGANSPAILFPYVRSFVTTLTANLGKVLKPLIIPTQFFHGNIDEVNDNEKELLGLSS